jgi:hypothetical protein
MARRAGSGEIGEQQQGGIHRRILNPPACPAVILWKPQAGLTPAANPKYSAAKEKHMHLEWWHWIVGGIALVLAELAIPSFFVIWFGLGACWSGCSCWPARPVADRADWRPGRWPRWPWSCCGSASSSSSQHKTLIGTADGEVIGEIGLLVERRRPLRSAARCASSGRCSVPRNGCAWPTRRLPPASGCGGQRSKAVI